MSIKPACFVLEKLKWQHFSLKLNLLILVLYFFLYYIFYCIRLVVYN